MCDCGYKDCTYTSTSCTPEEGLIGRVSGDRVVSGERERERGRENRTHTINTIVYECLFKDCTYTSTSRTPEEGLIGRVIGDRVVSIEREREVERERVSHT